MELHTYDIDFSSALNQLTINFLQVINEKRCECKCSVDKKRYKHLQIDRYNDFNALKIQLLNKLDKKQPSI